MMTAQELTTILQRRSTADIHRLIQEIESLQTVNRRLSAMNTALGERLTRLTSLSWLNRWQAPVSRISVKRRTTTPAP